MKQIFSCAAVVLATAGLIVGLTGSANAGTLKSAPFSAMGSDSVACSATNVGSSMMDYLTVWIINEKGDPVAFNACQDVTPGGTCSTSAKGGFCGIVFPGSSRNVRGSICLVDMDGSAKAALPAD